MGRCVSRPKLFHSKMEMMPVFSTVNFEQFNDSVTIEMNILNLNDNYANSHKSRC